MNRPVPELPIADDNDEVIELPESSGAFGGGNGSSVPAYQNLSQTIAHFQQDAPTCPACGHVTVRNGACYKCLNCGESLGCS